MSQLTSQSRSPIELQTALDHLRVTNPELNQEVDRKLEAALDYCENATGRAFRLTQDRTDNRRQWCQSYRFNYQPVKEIVSVTYLDQDDLEQTVDPSEYVLHRSWQSWLEFLEGATFPATANRGDAIRITYRTGYDTAEVIPPRLREAALLQLSILWGDLSPQEMTAYENSRDTILMSTDFGYR